MSPCLLNVLQYDRRSICIIDLQERPVPGRIGEGLVSHRFIDPAMSSKGFAIGIKDDPVFAVAGHRKCIVRDGIERMKVEDEDQVFPFEDDGLVSLVHIELIAEQ